MGAVKTGFSGRSPEAPFLEGAAGGLEHPSSPEPIDPVWLQGAEGEAARTGDVRARTRRHPAIAVPARTDPVLMRKKNIISFCFRNDMEISPSWVSPGTDSVQRTIFVVH
jgi:hypothetical protein